MFKIYSYFFWIWEFFWCIERFCDGVNFFVRGLELGYGYCRFVIVFLNDEVIVLESMFGVDDDFYVCFFGSFLYNVVFFMSV